MTNARAGERLHLTRRRRFARTAAVFGVGALATMSLLGTSDDPAGAAPGEFRVVSADPTAPVMLDSAARKVIGFGDSVPSGAACHCTNFVTAYAKKLPGTVAVANFAEGGTKSEDTLARLYDPGVAAKVRSATTVLIMTGANDFVESFADVTDGADPATSYTPVATEVRRNVKATVRHIQRMNPAAHIVVLDYWAAMQDGAVARQHYNAAARRAATEATRYLNSALASAARKTHVTFVSTLTAFKGPRGAGDPTPLLAPDGDHPNAAGHRRIAAAIAAVLPKG